MPGHSRLPTFIPAKPVLDLIGERESRKTEQGVATPHSKIRKENNENIIFCQQKSSRRPERRQYRPVASPLVEGKKIHRPCPICRSFKTVQSGTTLGRIRYRISTPCSRQTGSGQSPCRSRTGSNLVMLGKTRG